MYGAEFQGAALVALNAHPVAGALGAQAVPVLKVIDYRPTAAQLLVTDQQGRRWTLCLQRTAGTEWSGLPGSGTTIEPGRHGWLGL
jgi:hypothetical protein